MKNLNAILALSMLVILLTGCEKDPIETAQFETNNVQNLSTIPGMESIGTMEDLKAYIAQFPKPSKNSNSYYKEMSQVGAFTLTSNVKELEEICAETTIEDFSSIPENFYGGMTGTLSSETENHIFQKGSIVEGVELSTATGFIITVNNSFLGSAVFNTSGGDDIYLNFDNAINSFGLDVRAIGATGDVLNIKVFNAGELLETMTLPVQAMETRFIGINSNSKFDSIELSWAKDLPLMLVDNITFGSCSSDADGDGCLDEDDRFVNSNMEEFIIIGDCNTEILNQVTSECGVTMSDLIGEANETAKNHGGFVSAVTKLAKDWAAEGLISNTEKGKIINCAGNSN